MLNVRKKTDKKVHWKINNKFWKRKNQAGNIKKFLSNKNLKYEPKFLKVFRKKEQSEKSLKKHFNKYFRNKIKEIKIREFDPGSG